MEVFRHHIYEYSKGLRNLILHTTSSDHESEIIRCLEHRNIAYLIYRVNSCKINVFFGNIVCVDVIRKINKPCLCDYTYEEDFILGIMLGYDRMQQCERYLSCGCPKSCLAG